MESQKHDLEEEIIETVANEAYTLKFSTEYENVALHKVRNLHMRLVGLITRSGMIVMCTPLVHRNILQLKMFDIMIC